jgi:diacylglycerol kinase (ATP)
MRPCVIFNPTARGDKARRFREHLEALGAECALRPTPGPGTAARLAQEAVEEGFDTIIAAGGDGTLNEVLNGIGAVPNGFTRSRLGFLPLGTVNVFAKEIGLPSRLDRVWDVLRRGRERTIDVAIAEFAEAGLPRRRYFAQMAGAGLDARAIQLVDWETKKRVAQLAYVLAGLKALRETQPRIRFSDGAASAEGELVLVGNGRFYGGALAVFENADAADGALDVCVFERVNFFIVLRYALGFLTGRVVPPRSVRRFQSAAFEVSAAGPVPFEVEGELAGLLPARFSVQKRALRVIVP